MIVGTFWQDNHVPSWIANAALPAFIAIWCAAMLGGFAQTFRAMRKARRERRLASQVRVTWASRQDDEDEAEQAGGEDAEAADSGMRPERRGRNPVPLRTRLRESRRLAWYKLTRRMPRYKGVPGDGRKPLSARDRRVFDAVRSAEKRRQPLAAEPKYGRRQQ